MRASETARRVTPPYLFIIGDSGPPPRDFAPYVGSIGVDLWGDGSDAHFQRALRIYQKWCAK